MTSVSLDNERLAVIDLDDLDDDCKDYVDALLHVGLINEDDLKNPDRFYMGLTDYEPVHWCITTYYHYVKSANSLYDPKSNNVSWSLEDSDMINRALSVLGGNGWVKNLCRLWFYEYSLDNCQLLNLFFQVIPNLPCLHELELEIDVRPGIAERFTAMRDRFMANNPTMHAIPNSLREVYFSVNEKGGMHLEPAFLAFLDAFRNTFVQTSVFVVSCDDPTQGPRSLEAQAYFDKLEHTSIINIAGRRLVDGAKIWNDFKQPPLSIWPIVLERAQRNLSLNHANENTGSLCFRFQMYMADVWGHFDFIDVLEPDTQSASARATGLYYLLRHSPALLGRSHLIDSGSSAISNNRKRRRFKPNV